WRGRRGARAPSPAAGSPTRGRWWPRWPRTSRPRRRPGPAPRPRPPGRPGPPRARPRRPGRRAGTARPRRSRRPGRPAGAARARSRAPPAPRPAPARGPTRPARPARALVVGGRRAEEDALELVDRAPAQAHGGVEALLAQRAGVECAAQVVDRLAV